MNLNDQITKIILFAFLFTSLVLFNLSNCKKGEKDNTCNVAMVLAEISLGLFLPYFLYAGFYSGFVGIVVFIILFPILTKGAQSVNPLFVNTYSTAYHEASSYLPIVKSYDLRYSPTQFSFTLFKYGSSTETEGPFIGLNKNIFFIRESGSVNLITNNEKPEENRYAFINLTGQNLTISNFKFNNVSVPLTVPNDTIFINNDIVFFQVDNDNPILGSVTSVSFTYTLPSGGSSGGSSTCPRVNTYLLDYGVLTSYAANVFDYDLNYDDDLFSYDWIIPGGQAFTTGSISNIKYLYSSMESFSLTYTDNNEAYAFINCSGQNRTLNSISNYTLGINDSIFPNNTIVIVRLVFFGVNIGDNITFNFS